MKGHEFKRLFESKSRSISWWSKATGCTTTMLYDYMDGKKPIPSGVVMLLKAANT